MIMKKLFKKTAYLFSLGLFGLMFTGCDAKINPEVLAEYARTADPEMLREYAGVLNEVADGLESGEIEPLEYEDIDLDEFMDEGALIFLDEAEALIEDGDELVKEGEELLEKGEEKFDEAKEKAEEIIEEKKDSFEEKIVGMVIDEMMDNGPELDEISEFTGVDYEIYDNEGITSIVVCGTTSDPDYNEYAVYNYDTKTMKQLDNEDLLKLYDITEEDLNVYVCNTIGANILMLLEEDIDYIEEYYDVDNQEVASVIGTIAALYQYTVSNVDTTDNVQLYIDEDGDLAIACGMYIPAGTGWYNFTTKLITDEEPEAFEEYVEYANEYHYPELEMNSILLDSGMGYIHIASDEDVSDDFEYDSVELGFDDEDPSVFMITMTSGDEVFEYTGSIELVGINENGIEFDYKLNECNGKKLGRKSLEGTFDILISLEVDEDGEITGQEAGIQVVDGFDFTGADGEKVIFGLTEE